MIGLGDNLIYVKNLAKSYGYLIDDVALEGGYLLETKPFSYTAVLGGKKTIRGFESITSMEYEHIKYTVNDRKCSKKSYSYSWDKKNKWAEDEEKNIIIKNVTKGKNLKE